VCGLSSKTCWKPENSDILQLSGVWLMVGLLVMAVLYWVGALIIPQEER